MPSTPSALAPLLFAVGLFVPVVFVVAGVAFALVTRSKS
jgi:hypothetical protein